MATISFDLVSPENLIFNDDVGMIIVPGKDGDFGVLPGHSKVMSSLRPGRVMVYGEDKNLLKAFFVSGGFAEVNPEKCIVLAESVYEMYSIAMSAPSAAYKARRPATKACSLAAPRPPPSSKTKPRYLERLWNLTHESSYLSSHSMNWERAPLTSKLLSLTRALLLFFLKTIPVVFETLMLRPFSLAYCT